MDATCVTRILDSGGQIKGKANCEVSLFCPWSLSMSHHPSNQSWAIHWTSSSAPKAIIDNPFAPGFSAGGSSSGCAALVGSGEVDMGIGGDQSGSIRVVRLEQFALLSHIQPLICASLPACVSFRYRWSEANIWFDSHNGCHQHRSRKGHHRYATSGFSSEHAPDCSSLRPHDSVRI